MKKGKKIVLFVSMALLLVAGAVLNVLLLTTPNDTNGAADSVGNFFTTSKEDRLATRNYEIAQLDDILALEGDEYADARANAAIQKCQLVSAMDLELLIETLLYSQEFEDVFVAVSTASDTVNVIISSDELSYEDTVRIYNVISEEASISSEYVSITSL